MTTKISEIYQLTVEKSEFLQPQMQIFLLAFTFVKLKATIQGCKGIKVGKCWKKSRKSHKKPSLILFSSARATTQGAKPTVAVTVVADDNIVISHKVS